MNVLAQRLKIDTSIQLKFSEASRLADFAPQIPSLLDKRDIRSLALARNLLQWNVRIWLLTILLDVTAGLFGFELRK